MFDLLNVPSPYICYPQYFIIAATSTQSTGIIICIATIHTYMLPHYFILVAATIYCIAGKFGDQIIWRFGLGGKNFADFDVLYVRSWASGRPRHARYKVQLAGLKFGASSTKSAILQI